MARTNDTRDTRDKRATAKDAGDAARSTDLRANPMMAHLLDALEAGTDIGHYGRLTFVMVARHFMSAGEMLRLLARQPGHDEDDMRALIQQVEQRDYNPPKSERIHEWQARQDFPICPDPEDPRACNVYRDLQFPEGTYDHIQEFYEEQAEARPEA